jgi:hypothetical protein
LNLPKPASWAPVLANLGLLAGMLLVAYEINQNSNLARTALVAEGYVASNEFWANLMGEKPARVIAMAVECPEAMSYSDYFEMDAYLFTGMNFLDRNYQLAKEGIFTEEDWQASVEGYTGWYLGNPFGQAWWDEEGQHFFDEEFVNHVDKQLEGTVEDSYIYYLAVRARLLGPGNQDNAVVNSSCPPE